MTTACKSSGRACHERCSGVTWPCRRTLWTSTLRPALRPRRQQARGRAGSAPASQAASAAPRKRSDGADDRAAFHATFLSLEPGQFLPHHLFPAASSVLQSIVATAVAILHYASVCTCRHQLQGR